VRFSEVFLRLGSSLVAWMLVYAYAIWLAIPGVRECGPDGDELHRLLLGMVPVACVAALLLGLTRPLPEIHSILRWFGIPLALLLPLLASNIRAVGSRVMFDGEAICGEGAIATWQYLWAPAQAVAAIMVGAMVFRVWRTAALDRRQRGGPEPSNSSGST
jgi:hypothetical protein